MWILNIGLVIISIFFCLFSYFSINHGLVSFLAGSHSSIGNLYSIIDFANQQQRLLAIIYLLLLISLFVIQIGLLLKKNWEPLLIKSLFLVAGITTIFFSFGYPFISNDFFGYLFSGKIILDYHLNPYQVAPETFIDKELWFGFLRNIEQTYAYGFVSLLYYLIPLIIFSTNRFILDYFAIKGLNALLFYLTGILIYKLIDKDKKIFSLWFFNPLLVIELLINSHNDLLMICLFTISLFYLQKKRYLYSWIFLIASIFIKYVTIVCFPLMFLNNRLRTYFLRLLSLGIPVFLQLQSIRSVLPWYYIWSYLFLPFAKLNIWSWFLIYLMGFMLMINYYWGASLLIQNTQQIFNLLLVGIILIELDLKKRIRRKS